MITWHWLKTLHAGPNFTRYYFNSLVILIFLIIGFFFLTWPIVAYDTDLWYHLSGGRYFFENGRISDTSYFSFLEPVKHWYNYYWLFQIIVYTIFSYTSYYGLIVLRCGLFLLTAYFIYLQLAQKDESRIGYSIFFFIISVLALTQRELLVRPHLFSYLFIAVFLYLLEKKRDMLWLLPLLGILWSNIHGIEYPIMVMIALAYLAESFWDDWKKKGENKPKYINWFLIITCYTIFLTPGFLELIKTPFEGAYGQSRFQYLYINELKPRSWQTILQMPLFPVSNFIASSQHLFILASLVVFLVCLYKRNLRLSHTILFAGALALLFQHLRFSYEYILLTLPLIGHYIQSLSRPLISKKHLTAFIILPVLLFTLLTAYASHFKFRPAYPFSPTNLPTGITAFLKHINLQGNMLNNWNTGGYLQWSLPRDYKIAMDLQMSIFGDEDFAFISNALHDKNAFRFFLDKYNPSFLSVSLNHSDFEKVIADHTQFVPVFLDHNEILFINQNHFRDIADKYRLTAIDAFHVRDLDVEKIPEEKRKSIYDEARRILQIDENSPVASRLIGNIMIIQKNYGAALTSADRLIARHPELSDGYILKADALREATRYEEASFFYSKAMQRGQMNNMKSVYRNQFIVYNKLRDYKKGYKFYLRSFNPFSPYADYEEIYELALSASAAGKQKDALLFLNVAKLKVPPADGEYTKKISDMIAIIGL